MTRRYRFDMLVALLALGGVGVAPRAEAQQETISSAANQTFVVNDASTTASAITITDNAGKYKPGKDIYVVIPAALSMSWDNTVATVTITGGAAAKVSTTPTYSSATCVKLTVLSNFADGDQVIVSGLKFTSFTAAGGPANLDLGMNTCNSVATDDKTTTILAAPTLGGGANQVFTVGDPSTAMSTATITDVGGAITPARGIRLRIPASLNMTWNTTLTTATLGGTAASKVSTTVSYEDAGKTLVLSVTSNFATADVLTVSGLQFTSFTAVSAAAGLQLVVSGAGGTTASTSTTTKQIVRPTIASAANQTFVVGQAATAISTITITASNPSTITAANDIRVRIPSGFNMTWNTSLTTATIGGGAAAKVSTTVSYENSGQVLVLNVTTNFAASDQITVSGLQFTSFTAVSAASNLQLVISGAGGGTANTDTRTIAIVAPTISSAADQTFAVGQAATAMSTITISDANPASVTAANDIRIKIPSGFNMTWNTGLTTATLGGGAASKVSTTVNYADAGKTLVLNVTSNFVAGDQITVSGLQFTSFSAVSAASNIQLVVGGASAGVAAIDDRTITIETNRPVVSPLNTSASRLPSNGTNYIVSFTTQNAGSTTASYDLLTSKRPGTGLTTVSITGGGVTQGANPDSARLTNLAGGASVAVTVTYSVGNVAAGVVDSLVFKARSVADPTNADTGKLAVTVVRPSATLSKAVAPSGTQPPGTDLTYTVTLTNPGTASAASVVVVDTVASTVEFKFGSVVTNLPTGISVAVEYSNDGGSTWIYVPTSGGCSAPAGYDRCVNRIRWRLLNPLSDTPPDNTGNVQFISRIR
jgi:uncharacterized repeat protein (TIGR01451 family)